MALTKRFIPHAININTLGSAVQAWINEIDSYAPDQGVQLFEESGGSETDREFVSVRAVEPKMAIVTKDLSFLGTCGFAGIAVAPDASNAGLIAYGREVLSGALPTAIATTHHLKCLMTDGLLVPQSIRGGHGQTATFNLMMHAILGTAAQSGATPLVFSASNAIATGATAFTKLYTASVVKFNSTLCQGIMDIAVEFGLDVRVESDSGDVYPSFATIYARNPKIMFTTKDLELIATIGDGLATTSFAAYFQKCTANAQRVSKASGAHIGISGTLGIITPGAVELKHKTPGTTPYTWTPQKDTVSITISTTSTIPTT